MSKSPSVMDASGQTCIPPPYECPFATAINIASDSNFSSSISKKYRCALNRGSSNAMATLYFIGPLISEIRFARSFTRESKPVLRISAKYSVPILPISTGTAGWESAFARIASVSCNGACNARTKSLPVPPGKTRSGIVVVATCWRTRCTNPSPPTTITPVTG